MIFMSGRIAYNQKILKRIHPKGNEFYCQSQKGKIYPVEVKQGIDLDKIQPGKLCNIDLSYRVTELEGYHVATIIEVK
jgi:hypothetical protein